MKIRVRNFQAIEDATLEIEGLTVITGRTNLGKSALLRAVRGAMFGIPGDHYVREVAGKQKDWAGISIKDATTALSWVKVAHPRPGLETYLEINGQKHTKLGKEQWILTKPMGFRELVLTHQTLTPQIALQHDPIFLLTSNETTVAEVFKLLGRVDTVTEAQRLAKKDLDSTRNVLKVREKDRAQAITDLQTHDDVPLLTTEWVAMSASLQQNEVQILRRQHSLSLLDKLKQLQPRKLPAPVQFPQSPDFSLGQKIVRLQSLQPRNLPTEDPKPVPDPINLNQLLMGIDRLQKVIEKELALSEGIKLHHEEAMALELERETLEEELGTCPTCERSFGDQQVRHDHVAS